jgi:hypothetical protein
MNDARISNPMGASSCSGRRTGSGTQRNPDFGQRVPQCFFASSRTSTASGIHGYAPLLRLPSSSHNASSLPRAVPLTQNLSLMGIRQALGLALEQRTSALATMQSQTCSYVLWGVALGKMAARAHCVRHQTRRTFPSQNVDVALASSAQQGPRVGC